MEKTNLPEGLRTKEYAAFVDHADCLSLYDLIEYEIYTATCIKWFLQDIEIHKSLHDVERVKAAELMLLKIKTKARYLRECIAELQDDYQAGS